MTARDSDAARVAEHVRRCVTAGELEIDASLIHLNAMLLASPPLTVRNAIDRYRTALNRDPAGYLLGRDREGAPSRAAQGFIDVADSAAKYLGLTDVLRQQRLVAMDVIAQTTSTTVGLALLANGIVAKPGQEIVISMHDFFSWRESWQLRCDRSGLGYREIQLYDDPSAHDLADIIVKNVLASIGPRTRVVALSWVHSSTGVKLPIDRIGEGLQTLNSRRTPGDQILLCVDGVHGFGVENTSFPDLKCDFFVTGCHKWLFGPRGTGIICAMPDAWAQVTPTIPSFLAMGSGGRHSPGGVACYEHAWAVKEAFEYHETFGKDKIHDYTHGLARRLKAGLSGMPGLVRLVTPMSDDLSSGVVCCEIIGMEPAAAVKSLREARIIAMTSAPDVDGREYLRMSPSVLNTESAIDTALAEIETMATRAA